MSSKLIYWRWKERGGQFFEGYLNRRNGPLVAIKPREYALEEWYKESELEIIEGKEPTHD
jgi:hypothetical protein